MGETQPLFRGEFLHRTGILARVGHLTLTEDELSFEHGRVDRLAGAKPWSVPIEQVKAVKVVGLDRAVVVKAADAEYKLSGGTTSLLRDRLAALLAQRDGTADDKVRYEPGERVILYGPGVLFRPRWLDASGVAELTTSRFRFNPSFSARISGPNAALDLRIGDIVDVRLVGVRRVLEIELKNGVRRIGGPLASAFFVSILALREGGDTSAVRTTVYAGTIRNGALAHPGQMVVTQHRVRFVTTGMLDAMVGVKEDLDIALADIVRADAEDKTIVIRAGNDEHTFELDHADRCLDAIAPLVAAVPTAGEPALDERGAFATAELEQLITGWSEAIEPELLEEPRLATPVVVHTGGNRLHRRFLVQTKRAAFILPIRGPAGDKKRLTVIRYDEGLEPLGQDLNRNDLELKTTKRTLRLLTRTGNKLVKAFWDGVPEIGPREQPRGEKVLEPTEAGSERREAYRVALPMTVMCRVTIMTLGDGVESSGKKPAKIHKSPVELKAKMTFEGRLCDISAHGLGMTMEVPIPAGSEVLVQSDVTDCKFKVLAKIVHHRAEGEDSPLFRHGVRVWDPDADSRARMQKAWAAYQRDELTREKS